MAALSAVAPVLNKAPVVSTGKAANTNSMMVWQPHGNKCVSPPAPRARLRELGDVAQVAAEPAHETPARGGVRGGRQEGSR